MSSIIDVSVIIVSWNTAELLQRCLHSIYEGTHGISFQVCVVDNGSTDKSAEMIASVFPKVILKRNSANRGFAAASNQGIHASIGRYVLLLNSDTVVPAGALAAMVAFADGHWDVGIVGPRLIGADGTVEMSGQEFPSLLKSLAANNRTVRKILPRNVTDRLLVRGWEATAACDVGYVGGACMLVRKAAFEKVGVLDEDYFMYGEEIDWCYRMRNAGWRVVYYPQAQIVHLHNRSGVRKWGVGGLAARKIGERLFYRKAYGTPAVVVFSTVQMLLSLMRFLGYSILSLLPGVSDDCRSIKCQQAEMQKLSLFAMIGLYNQKHLSRHPN